MLLSIKSTFALFVLLCMPGLFDQVYTAKVIGISDGDTITVLVDNTQIKIRVDGIDCPESRQPFGTRAKQFTSDFCYGKIVTIKKKELDRYGRTIARVICDGKDLSEELLKAGMAWHFKKYDSTPKLSDLEIQARKRKVGLWSEPDPVAPWCFRHPQNCIP